MNQATLRTEVVKRGAGESHCSAMQNMKSLTSTHYLVICCLIATASSIAGFFIGEKAGVKKGAVAGAWFAKSSLDSEKDMLLIIENALIDGQHESDIRRLMIGGLEKYIPARLTLSAEPFGQSYELLERDKQRIDQAVQRLRTKEMILKYRQAEPATSAKAG